MNENLIEQLLSGIRCLDKNYCDDFVAGYRRVILKSCDILEISPHYTVDVICYRIKAFTYSLYRERITSDDYMAGAFHGCKYVTTFLIGNKDKVETLDPTTIEQAF